MDSSAPSSTRTDVPFNVLASTGVPVDYLDHHHWQPKPAQQRSKSPPDAFKPTPNDTLLPQSAPPSIPRADGPNSRQLSKSLPQTTSLSSSDPSRPSFATNAFPCPAPMSPILGNPAMPSLMSGGATWSARRSSSLTSPFQQPTMPPIVAPAPNALDAQVPLSPAEVNWETLYNRQRDMIDEEREIWKYERTILRREIEQLKAQLAAANNKFGVDGHQQDGQTPDHGHALQGSQLATANTPTPSSSPPGGRRSPVPRLPSISEDEVAAPVLRSMNGENRFSSIDSAIERGVDQALKDEQPLAPDPTPAFLSPPPNPYVKDAGHTPAKLGSISPTGSLHSPVHPPRTRENTDINALPPEDLPSVEDDPALKGPLALPSTPEHPKAPAMLDALQGMLQEVEKDPDAHKPVVMQGHSSTSNLSEISQPAGFSDNKENEPAHAESDEPPMQIRLKKKQSLNFGAPLGKLRM